MKYFLFVLLVISGIVACSGRKVPKGILEPEKMEAVVWDLVRSGEFLNGYVLYRDTFTNAIQESQRWYEKVYEQHGITKDEFILSYNYYKEHPQLFRTMFDSMAVYSESLAIDSSKAVSPTDSSKTQAGDSTAVNNQPAITVRPDSGGNRLIADTAAMLRRRMERRIKQRMDSITAQ